MVTTEPGTLMNAAVRDSTIRTWLFADTVVGRWIDLDAILAQHQRSEKQAQRKLQPAIRVTGFEFADTEAAELCDAIDALAENQGTDMPPCAKVSSFAQRLDW